MSLQFSKDLIKGRIAEVIFEQMIREEGKFNTIPFGYEYTVPMLTQYKHLVKIQQVINNICDAPDFALVSNDKTEVYLVEVKYRSKLDGNDLKKMAQKLCERWNPSWLFVATLQGFYFSPSSRVAKTGKINNLSTNWVSRDRQGKYLKLLNEFEK